MEEQNPENAPSPFRLSQGEIVRRHQLNLMKFWDEKSAESAEATEVPSPCGVTEIPNNWRKTSVPRKTGKTSVPHIHMF